MALTRLALRRPLTMLMIILALVVMGYRAFTFLQIDRFPGLNLLGDFFQKLVVVCIR